MTLERNLLQDVMDELSEEYTQKNWQIEALDLRWGITKEAGLDNRTVQICVEELRRCREMSPHPNFIVLLGNRYGWIPLPEVLSCTEMEAVKGFCSDAEDSLLDRWYRCDYNQLPEPEFILQPREGRYVSESVWEDEVYRPLRSLFDRSGDGRYSLSATEIEIQEGALHVDNADEHVIGYFRSLSEIPSDMQNVFTDENARQLTALKENLEAKLSHANTYYEILSYSEYQSDSFKLRFKENMKEHLISVINHAIEDFEELGDENDFHMDLAEKESGFFVGREEELSYIDDYINNPEANYALWYCARSGAGKSALISQVAGKYKDSHNIILRFCCETGNTVYGSQLLSGIEQDINRLYPNWNSLDGIRANPRPLLVLIDGMNQLTEEPSKEHLVLKWADKTLAKDVRIILTSTESYASDYKTSVLYKRDLGPLSAQNSNEMVSGLLRLNKRRLSIGQLVYIKQVIADSDKRPIYLTSLANFLSRFHSYDVLPEIPVSFNDLVYLILEHLSSAHNHDSRLVKLALSFFAVERKGLSQSELLRLLGADNGFVRHLQSSSFHELHVDEGSPEIPPVLWSRLFADISFFFKTRHGKWGDLLYIYHNEFSNAIEHVYMQNPEELAAAYSSLADFYRNFDTAHAYAEAFQTRYMASNTIYDYCRMGSKHDDDLIELLTNPYYIYGKLCEDKNELIYEFDKLHMVLKRTRRPEANEIFKMKNDIADIVGANWDVFLLQCMNLHGESPLRALIGEKFHDVDVLTDTLGDAEDYNLTVNTSTRPGTNILIGDDGSRLLSVYKSGYEVQVEDMDDYGNTKKYSLESPVLKIDASSDLRIHAILSDKGLLIYDYIAEKILVADDTVIGATWVTISADGSVYACGGRGRSWSNRFKLNAFYTASGKLSPSGRCLWIASNDGLYKFDSNTHGTFGMNFNDLYNGQNDKNEIIAADDAMCVLHQGNYLFYISTFKNEQGKECYRALWSKSFEQERIIGAVADGKLLTVRDYNFGDCRIYDSNMELDYSTNLYNLSAISRNMKYIYSELDQKCYDTHKKLKTYSTLSGENVGINTLASDCSGNLMVVVGGKNHLFETSGEILLSEDGNALRKLEIPQCDTEFFSTCGISPSGDTIWLSEYRANQCLLMIDRGGDVLLKIPEAGSEISINYTDDGNYIVALRGHHISDPEPVIHILTSNGKLVRKFIPKDSEGLLALKGRSTISHCNRYAISEDGDIIDLIDERLIFCECHHKFEDAFKYSKYRNPRRMSPLNTYPLFAVYPVGGIVRGKFSQISLKGEVLSAKYGKKIIGCTHSGRYFFSMDEDRSLYLLNPFSMEECLLAQNMSEIYPMYNERYMFIIQTDGMILFYDIMSCRILQRAFFPEYHMFCINAKGLAAVSRAGKLCQFEPDEKYHICSEMSVTIAYRWNLETKKRSSIPTAVCPACAHVFEPSSDVVLHISSHDVTRLEDWDEDILRCECPSCHAEIKFNPMLAE